VKEVFLETIKIIDRVPQHIAYHQARYESVVHACKKGSCKKLVNLIKTAKEGILRCRVIYDCEDILSITYHPYEKRVIKTLQTVEIDSRLSYDKKYLDRSALDKLFEQRKACDDVLLVHNGYIKDTTIANVAFLSKGIWYTPKEPLLKGTTRQRLLDEGKIVEAELSLDEIKSFESLALMNAMIDFDIIQNKRVEDILC